MKKKRLLSMFLLVFTLFGVFNFFNPTEVKAAIDGTLSHPKTPNVYYTRRGGGKPYMSAQYEQYTMNGKVVYCIEPGVDITNTSYLGYDGLQASPYDDATNKKIELIGHYGYDYPGHQTLRYRMATLQGYRNEQPVALVERKLDESVEYVIAFNYEIKNNELSWGYGYYYDDNFDKAIKDYQKVILGGDLADTFAEKKDTLKVKIIGIDNWDRPVYQDEKGKLYKDVNLGTGCLALCTATNNQFYGEPDTPISDDIDIEVVKNFNKNKNKNMER